MKNAIQRFQRCAALREIHSRGHNRTKGAVVTAAGPNTKLSLNPAGVMVLVLFVQILIAFTTCRAQSREKPSYPAMASLNEYVMKDKAAEIALARSAGPRSISDKAEVMVLGRTGYKIAVKGTNGFVCIVERSWATSTDDPEFWNQHIRAPICFNPAAAKTFLPIYLLKTGLVLAGKSKAQIARAISSAFENGKLPSLAPNSMCYMMSKRQYLNDEGKRWHPHLMFYVRGEAAKSWGANLPGSPVLASNDPQERATVFMVLVEKWSDGTSAPPVVY